MDFRSVGVTTGSCSTSKREGGLTWGLELLGVSLSSLHTLSERECCLEGKVSLSKQLASDPLVIHAAGQPIPQHLRELVSKVAVQCQLA